MVNHLTGTTAWAENQAGFFRHSTNVMLLTWHVPSACDAGHSAAREGGIAPTGGSQGHIPLAGFAV